MPTNLPFDELIAFLAFFVDSGVSVEELELMNELETPLIEE